MTKTIEFSTFPRLQTKRLTLRELRTEDGPHVLVFRSDPYVQRYNGPVFKDVAEAESLIMDMRNAYDARAGICWGVTLTGEDRVLGMFGFHHWNHYHRRAELGYDMARDYWGQGIASETVRAIVKFGFEQMNLNYIYAGTIADNHESVRLLERVGFQREGTRRQFSWEDDGTFHDSAMYGILRHELIENKDS